MSRLVMVVMMVRFLDNRIARGTYVSDLGWQMHLAVFVIVAVVGTLGDRGEWLASFDQICDDRSMGPDAAAARPLGIAFHFAFAALAASLIALERNDWLLAVSVRMSYT